MIVKHVYDPKTNEYLGVVVAVATNCVGYAIYRKKKRSVIDSLFRIPDGYLCASSTCDNETKKDLVSFAIAMAVTKTIKACMDKLYFYVKRDEKYKSPSVKEFEEKVWKIIHVYEDTIYKATMSDSLPTLVNKGVSK